MGVMTPARSSTACAASRIQPYHVETWTPPDPYRGTALGEDRATAVDALNATLAEHPGQ
jgi:hypothetical protein